MYSRNTPLWAETYHLFQNSIHGKYRFREVMDIPRTDSTIGNKLKEFQNPNAIQFFDQWFKDIVKNAENSDEIDAVIKQIEDFISTIDKADRKNMKIIKRKNEMDQPMKKDLSRLAAYAETLKKSTLRSIQKHWKEQMLLQQNG